MSTQIDFTRGWTRVAVVGDLPAGQGTVRLRGDALTFTRSAPPGGVETALGRAAQEGYALGKEKYPEEDVIVTARLSDGESFVEVTVGHFPTSTEPDQCDSDSDAAEMEFVYARRAPKRERRVGPLDGELQPPRPWEGLTR